MNTPARHQFLTAQADLIVSTLLSPTVAPVLASFLPPNKPHPRSLEDLHNFIYSLLALNHKPEHK